MTGNVLLLYRHAPRGVTLAAEGVIADVLEEISQRLHSGDSLWLREFIAGLKSAK